MAIADAGNRVWVEDDQLIIQWQTAVCMAQVEYFDAAPEATAIVHWTVEK